MIGNEKIFAIDTMKNRNTFVSQINRRLKLTQSLTDNIQINRITFNWLRWNLTVVAASVAFLNPFYLKRPLVGRSVVRRLETKVSRIRICADG